LDTFVRLVPMLVAASVIEGLWSLVELDISTIFPSILSIPLADDSGGLKRTSGAFELPWGCLLLLSPLPFVLVIATIFFKLWC
jgi:hypothetical protein